MKVGVCYLHIVGRDVSDGYLVQRLQVSRDTEGEEVPRAAYFVPLPFPPFQGPQTPIIKWKNTHTVCHVEYAIPFRAFNVSNK